MLATLLGDRKPTHVAVAFDLPGGTFRTERLPSYKGTRDATPPEFEPQVPLMREVLEGAWAWSPSTSRDYEADDFSRRTRGMGREAGMRVLVVSGDRDTIQLVTDDVTLLYPRKGVSDLVEYTPERCSSVRGRPAPVSRTRRPGGGDLRQPSRRAGVGPKTAAKWIATYGGLDGILASANDVPGKAGESLRAHLER